MPQNFLYPQRDQLLLLPVDMREWLPEGRSGVRRSGRGGHPGIWAGSAAATGLMGAAGRRPARR
jgi:hypothetical protein